VPFSLAVEVLDDCQGRPVSEGGVTAHLIVVPDSLPDDGPEFLDGFGVEDQRWVLDLEATEEGVHGHKLARGMASPASRPPAACRIPRNRVALRCYREEVQWFEV
jgi:hypothetical protein